LLIFIVAYNAEKTIETVLSRIPASLVDDYRVEVLIIDDASPDATFEQAARFKDTRDLPFDVHVLFNPVNQGYGGNQKIGYHFAVEHGFDYVALVHGDGQYAPESLPDLVAPLRDGDADAVFGSRMLARGDAVKGGMPLYKFVGNKILSWIENRVLGTRLSEFHSGYRVYSVDALKRVPFALNTNDFHFDTEIIVQFVFAGLRIEERPIPTFYGDEISHVNGLKYAWNVVKAVLVARAQGLGLLYDRRFDCASVADGEAVHRAKLGFESPQRIALKKIPDGARVLDLGYLGGYVGQALKDEKGCHVTGVYMRPLDPGIDLDRFIQCDLNDGLPDLEFADFDYVLMLEVIEHLVTPERFVDRLREALSHAPNTRLLVSTGNIGFLITRAMLTIGHFNYGKRGILDITHARLFTFASLRRLFEQGGFRILATRGIPAPFPIALRGGAVARLLLAFNRLGIVLWRTLFSYQMFMEIALLPSLPYLLETAVEKSAAREAAAAPRRAGGRT
jgi:glycosyltransferase involved in cell wall biosynthesis